MRLRDPEHKLENITPKEIVKETLHRGISNNQPRWRRYQVQLITPMFGGGTRAGEPDDLMPIRATAIRGQLRYWWRFLARHRKDNPLDGESLFAAEREIWGGMAENDTDYSSKVRLRIRDIRKKNVQEYDEKEAPYALFPARKQQGDNRARKLVREGLTFTLEIAAPSQLMTDEVEPALRWWATFGGLGSRTRRGLGTVEVRPVDNPECLGGVLHVSKNEVNQACSQCRVVMLDKQNDAKEAWVLAVKILQQFRQLTPVFQGYKIVDWEGIGRRTRTKNIDGQDRLMPGKSNWPEADAIRRKTGRFISRHRPNSTAPICFPRILFGLPLHFSFFSDGHIPPDTDLSAVSGGTVYDRIASPLILKPVAVGYGEYRPTALVLPYDHIEACTFQLEYAKKENRSEAEKEGKPYRWTLGGKELWGSNDVKKVMPVKKNDGTDSLTAFMNFFKQGGQIDE